MNQEGGQLIKARCLNRILDIINKVLPNRLKFKTEREKLADELAHLIDCPLDEARHLLRDTSIVQHIEDAPSSPRRGGRTRRYRRVRKRRTRKRRKRRHTRRRRRRGRRTRRH